MMLTSRELNIVKECGQFTHLEVKGRGRIGDIFTWKGSQWRVVYITLNWVYAKPL